MRNLAQLLILLLVLASCGESSQMQTEDTFISTLKGFEVKVTDKGTAKIYSSTSAGNLMATAIKEVYDLDVVLYPQALINDNNYGFAHPNLTSNELNYLLDIYPKNGNKDQFMIGLMDGAAIKKLIRTRVQDTFNLDVEVAGLVYNINLVAGVLQNASFELDDGRTFDDKTTYRIAINQHFFFSGETFPSYKFRNGLNFSFVRSGVRFSARDALTQYLLTTKTFPWLDNKRGMVIDYELNDAGRFKTYQIQSDRHRSPLWGKKVTTTGIVTALSNVEWYPRGIDLIIQDPQGDGRVETSDALHIHLDADASDVQIGDEIEVSGTVWERMTLDAEQNMSKTVIRNVTNVKIISSGNELPEPVLLGFDGRQIPDQVLSTFKGNLNFKTYLTMTDGIDFWESLEGMRVKIRNPRVTGFRGGHEELARQSVQRYITLYILPDGKRRKYKTTYAGGVREDFMLGDYSPEVLHLSTGNLSAQDIISEEDYYNVGDIIEADIVGNISYEMNLFGGGEYTFVMPVKEQSFTSNNILRRKPNFPENTGEIDCESVDPNKTHWPLECRPRTTLKGEGNKLTVATFNLKNLSSNEDGSIDYGNERMSEIGKSISFNLQCPDIVNLVEVQDDNGQDLQGGTGAERTLEKIIEASECDKEGVLYKSVNIDPINHSEGGQPGGNIRVSIIYNSARVGFTPKFDERYNGNILNRELRETTVTASGDLSVNPGRIFPLSSEFRNTRKSIVAQFSFRGEKVFIIGNHLNSKLGDSSFWGERQPPYIKSDEKRHATATLLAQFVRILDLRNDQKANVIVLGDFNAHYNERSMTALSNNGDLTNLMFVDALTPAEERYTHNYNGESSAIDFIFASKGLMTKDPKCEPIHINSDYMGRLSDHDPVMAQFSF